MATYMCRECGEVFDDDNCKTFDFNYYSDPRDIDLDGMPMCPRCESMDYDEVHECEVCGEYTDDVLCECCKAKAAEMADYAQKRWSIDFQKMVDMLSLRMECHA